MGKPSARSLDTALPASIDHIALNNQVVGMRKTVKRTKVQLINRMVKRVRVLKNFTKGSEQEIAKKKRKAERILQEIDVIKKLDPDQVSKYALSSTTTVTELADQPSGSVTKALAQYSNHKVMQDLVGKFRDKHPDWKALAAYLLSKNTGRRYKKKATKEKMTADAAAAKREARDKLLNNFLEQKGSKDKDISKPSNVLRKKNKEKRTAKASENDEFSVSELKKSVSTFDNSDSDISESNDKVSDEAHLTTKPVLKTEISRLSSNVSRSASHDRTETTGRVSLEKGKNSSEEANSAVTDNVDDQTSDLDPAHLVNEAKGKTLRPKGQSKHMVIQTFSLQDASEDTIPVRMESRTDPDYEDCTSSDTTQVPEFLMLPKSDSKPTTTRVKKDAFFIGGEDSTDSGTESSNDRQADFNSDGSDSGSDLEDNVGQLQKGKVAMRSTFVGSLTDNRRDKISTWAHKHSSLRPQGHKSGGDQGYVRGHSHRSRGQGRGRGQGHGRGQGRDSHASRRRGQSSWDRDSGQMNRKRRGEDPFHFADFRHKPSGNRQNYSSPAKHRKQNDSSQPRQSNNSFAKRSIRETTAAEPEKLHPSWQASKQRKQQMGKIQTFQGKKTTFDDD